MASNTNYNFIIVQSRDNQVKLEQMDSCMEDSMMGGQPVRKRKRLDHLSPEEKLYRRKLKNREAAQTARDRKKALMDTFENRVSILEADNVRLRRENNKLKEQMNKMMKKEAKQVESNTNCVTSSTDCMHQRVSPFTHQSAVLYVPQQWEMVAHAVNAQMMFRYSLLVKLVTVLSMASMIYYEDVYKPTQSKRAARQQLSQLVMHQQHHQDAAIISDMPPLQALASSLIEVPPISREEVVENI